MPDNPPSPPLAPLRVLFVGNSQVRWGAGDVPALVASLSRSAPAGVRRVEPDAVAIGGASLEVCWKHAATQAKLAEGGWDWLVVNEIIYSYGGNSAGFQEYARRLAAEAHRIGARMLFFATGEIESAKTEHEPMYRDALALARECGGRVAGAGMAWARAWSADPALDFHAADRAHPNLQGYYLNACVLYAALTDHSPIGLDPCGLPPDTASFLQTIAWAQYRADRALDSAAALPPA